MHSLLGKGYAVRGTVRLQSKGQYLNNAFVEDVEKVSLVTVVDSMAEQEGLFNEAVEGVTAIEHTASPFHLRADDPVEHCTDYNLKSDIYTALIKPVFFKVL